MTLIRSIYKSARLSAWSVKGAIARGYLALTGVDFGQNLTIYSLPYCRVCPGSKITIGNNCAIYNRLTENAAGITNRTALVTTTPSARISIGNHVGISGSVLFAACEIIIEDYVNIGAGSLIYDTDHHPANWEARRVHDTKRIGTRPVRIKNDAFIGARTIVLKGVTVGARSIVAAGAVVTDDIPDDTLAAGVPAKPIKKLN
jgi:acetyltransferase-like isoleucine patch superfamily enzyme